MNTKIFFKTAMIALLVVVCVNAADAVGINGKCQEAHSTHHSCNLSMVRGSCNVPGHSCKGFSDSNGDNYCDNCPGKCHAVTHQPK